MQRSPEELRSFYLIAINKDSAPTDVGDTDGYGKVLPLSTLWARTPRREEAAAATNFDSVPSGLGRSGAGGSQHKTFLRNSLVARKGSACQQCRLGRFQCDLQKPSCWKCQQYSSLCYYEDDYDSEYIRQHQQIEEHVDLGDAPRSWHDSVRVHPYQSLEGKKKLYRVDKDKRPPGARRARLSKPIPEGKRVRFDVEDIIKEEEEILLRSFSPTISEGDTASRTSSPISFTFDITSRVVSAANHFNTASDNGSQAISEFDAESTVPSLTTARDSTISRTASLAITESDAAPLATSLDASAMNLGTDTVSPIEWVGREPAHPVSRSHSPCSSEYTTSTVSIKSEPTGSSLRHSMTVRTTPPTTGASSSWLTQIIVSSWDDTPKVFQCTFCLRQCKDLSDWKQHELSQHIQKKIWICMPSGPDRYGVCAFCCRPDPDPDHFSQHRVEECSDEKKKDRTFVSKDALRRHLSTVHNQTEMTPGMHKWARYPKDHEWYWNCGFCDTLLTSLTDRMEHLGVHFNEGVVMSSWDPLTPPYPLDRTTLNSAAWFPPLDWDARTLWDLEHKPCNGSSTSELEDQLSCQYCDACFKSKADIKRHENIWHSRREVWSCPTVDDIETGILASHFFPDRHAKSSDDDTCPLCNERFVNIAKSYPDNDDIWDVRIQHLDHGHNFNRCDPICKSTRAATMMLHLANIHNVSFNQSTFDVLESCRRDERPLARKMDMHLN